MAEGPRIGGVVRSGRPTSADLLAILATVVAAALVAVYVAADARTGAPEAEAHIWGAPGHVHPGPTIWVPSPWEDGDVADLPVRMYPIHNLTDPGQLQWAQGAINGHVLRHIELTYLDEVERIRDSLPITTNRAWVVGTPFAGGDGRVLVPGGGGNDGAQRLVVHPVRFEWFTYPQHMIAGHPTFIVMAASNNTGGTAAPALYTIRLFNASGLNVDSPFEWRQPALLDAQNVTSGQSIAFQLPHYGTFLWTVNETSAFVNGGSPRVDWYG